MWEFNNFLLGRQAAQKNDIAQAILTGYYCAYYTNGGKKAKNPNDLIAKVFSKKQNYEEAMRQINLARQMEQNNPNKEVPHVTD